MIVLVGLVGVLGLHSLLLPQQPAYSQNESSTSLIPPEQIYYDGIVNVTIQYPDDWIAETRDLNTLK